MKIEKELRFVLSEKQYQSFKEKVSKTNIEPGHAVMELTTMYDNPNPEFTFYSNNVDGRLRVRVSEAVDPDIIKTNLIEEPVSMLTWKQRIPENFGNTVNQEYEIEVKIAAQEMKHLIQILEDVLRCHRISSYQRIRETFYISGVEIASDTFPYGHVIELELKNSKDENILYKVAEKLGLDQFISSTRSCDDMYEVLCEKNGLKPKSDILFSDDEMPNLSDAIEKGVL